MRAIAYRTLVFLLVGAPASSRKGHHKQHPTDQFNSTAPHFQGRNSSLPRFALCLSGEVRTFAATAPRFRELVASNPVTDTFGFVGYAGREGSSTTTAQKASAGPRTPTAHKANAAPTEAALTAARRATNDWPGSVRVVACHARAVLNLLFPPEACCLPSAPIIRSQLVIISLVPVCNWQVRIEGEDANPFVKLAKQWWHLDEANTKHCPSYTVSSLMQAHKVALGSN
jgi:hypothetical protein